MKRHVTVIALFTCFLMVCGTTHAQTGTIDDDYNIVTRIAYEGTEFEVQFEYDQNKSGASGHYWKFKGFKPVELTNALGMTFRLIPAGTFIMGSPADELGRETDETQHEVRLSKPLYMQTTEVTQAQWTVVMGTNPFYFKSCGVNCPVENVSWDDVQAFITALNALGIGTYRLPTEAEWEYAARAGSTMAFANGPITEVGCADDPILDAMGWYCYNSNNTTQRVAHKQPNAWGLYDMHGNVYEWCQDWYGDYPSTLTTDPTGPATGFSRVFRGGTYAEFASDCRSADRNYFYPDFKCDYLGFRLVRDN